MSRHTSQFLLCGTAIVFASVAQAADELPKDGAWARYYVQSKGPDGTEHTFHTTIRFVGTVVEKGKRCRWVEWTEAVPADGDDGKKTIRKSVLKFLFTEKSLRESSQPLPEFIRGWSGEEGKPPSPLETTQRNRETTNISGTNLVFLPGVLKTTKATRNPRTVDYQQGQLRLKTGRSGTYEAVYHPSTVPLVFTWKTDYELWLHKDVPLGMASTRMKMVFIRKDAKGKKTVRDLATIEWWVEAWGTDAKSAFPDAK